MTMFTTNGCKLLVGQALNGYSDFEPDNDIYNAQTWQLIENVISLGHIDEEVETVRSLNIDPNNPDRIQRYTIDKVAITNGVMEVITALNLANAGQLTLVRALHELCYYPFRLVFNNASERLFIAQIIKVTEQYEEANNVAKLIVDLSIASSITRIEATQ